MDAQARYHRYLMSKRWAAKRQKVMARCRWICERCHHAGATEVHHKTYARVYRERLTDLLGLCRPCHQFVHGLQASDPVKKKLSIGAQFAYRTVVFFFGQEPRHLL
jgi:5-methylcytosine-specific restriction endonuclease McrA